MVREKVRYLGWYNLPWNDPIEWDRVENGWVGKSKEVGLREGVVEAGRVTGKDEREMGYNGW